MPPAPTVATLHRSFLTLSQSWPVDRLRPTLQFGGAIRAAAERIFGTEAARKELSDVQLVKAERSVESLERLLQDKAKKAYPISDKTLKPASFPKQYQRLREGIERSARGEVDNRGWFSWIRWK